MGTGGRRAGRGLRRAPALAGEIGGREHAFVIPALGIFYALAFGSMALALNRLLAQVEGPWFEVLGAGVLLTAVVATVQMLRVGWRRHREELNRRAAAWGAGALLTILLGFLATYVLVQSASIASVISGADVRLTRPVLQGLPRPSGATLLDERPGLTGTESVTDYFSSGDLGRVIPFYEAALPGAGWVEEKPSQVSGEARFSKGQFLVTVAPDQPSGNGTFAVTVDHLLSSPVPSPSASTASSP